MPASAASFYWRCTIKLLLPLPREHSYYCGCNLVGPEHWRHFEQGDIDNHEALAFFRALVSPTGFGYSYHTWKPRSYTQRFIGAEAARTDDGCVRIRLGCGAFRKTGVMLEHTAAKRCMLHLLSSCLDKRAQSSKIRLDRIERECTLALTDHKAWKVLAVDGRIRPFLRPNPLSMLVLADLLEESGISPTHADAIRAVGGEPVAAYLALQTAL